MPDSLPFDVAARDVVIRAIDATIVDVPTIRRHKLAQTAVSAQSYVIVRALLANGVEGIGEAATLGGPRWSEESVEAIKANIDAYLAPALLGQPADRIAQAGLRLDAAAKRNNAAKAAVESALFDALGKTLGVPVAMLLGGVVRDRFPVLWTLASGDAGQEIEEAEQKLEAREHRVFKVKLGAQAPEADLARIQRIAAALGARAELIADINQAWDETTARRWLPALHELGLRLAEQPLPAWNIAAMARLRGQAGMPPLLADESVFDLHDMLAVAREGAADAVSLKLVKHGGLLGLHRVAAVAGAAGIGLYGGCLLESSVGAAAHLHAFAALPALEWGREHFGPRILTADLAETPLVYEDFHVLLPPGSGLGVRLDEAALARFTRH